MCGYYASITNTLCFNNEFGRVSRVCVFTYIYVNMHMQLYHIYYWNNFVHFI